MLAGLWADEACWRLDGKISVLSVQIALFPLLAYWEAPLYWIGTSSCSKEAELGVPGRSQIVQLYLFPARPNRQASR